MSEQPKSMWLEISGADGRDYDTARKANKDWLAGVEFQDNTTKHKITIKDIGPGLNVVIRYRGGTKVTNAEFPSDVNPEISHSEAKAILEGLSHKQAEEWKTVANPDEVEIDLTNYKENPETD